MSLSQIINIKKYFIRHVYTNPDCRSIGGKRDPWLFTSPMEYGYYGDVPKRNFDEIDR